LDISLVAGRERRGSIRIAAITPAAEHFVVRWAQ
jgi:hypothetical protein